MEHSGPRENGRYKPDQYRGVQTQWMIPSHLLKDPHALSIRVMSILSERDSAYQERDLALSEKKVALAERDMAILQRDTAITERNNALIERDNVIAAFEYRETATMSVSSSDFTEIIKPELKKRRIKPRKGEEMVTPKEEWKDQDLGLNQVLFDDSSMPVPVCSCTGILQQCYKWGSGGWQSACCTMTMSVYPLPMMANKRHARVSGRKMSGSAFTKLLSRLALEGYDLSAPLDLKDHWAKHGTNRYITIK